ncbi:MAG: hypothetical protein IT377_13530 [Polyangiaceae bacterium]|nr:hypothetical protein [Polyangiaceae bacterium]
MISGFETPTQGQIFIAERDVTHDPPYRRDAVHKGDKVFCHLHFDDIVVVQGT